MKIDKLTLSSAFQPIVSFTHGRLVGWEALLRAKHASTGVPVPPGELFSGSPASGLDVAALTQHLSAFSKGADAWLFLNLHPATLSTQAGLDSICAAVDESGQAAASLVFEVLETPFHDRGELSRAVETLRSMGCLIAIDDFGAGDSNFERIFEFRPEVVKFDRRVIQRASRSEQSRRIIEQMVALIHECGSLVLMEGIETETEAHTALCCDADLVQGWHFGRPQELPLDPAIGTDAVTATWKLFDKTPPDRSAEAFAAHLQAVELATVMLCVGKSLEEACGHFLSLEGSEMCYLLDADGRQVARNAFRNGLSHRVLSEDFRFKPVHDTRGARWARRHYFQAALKHPDVVQLSRPYLTLQGRRMCRTVSMSFKLGGKARVLCGDVQI